MKIINSSGNRKTAVARATLKEGTGIIRINTYTLEQIPNAVVRERIEEPLVMAGETAKKVNISVNTFGGGIIGQAEAARIAIARALAQFNKNLTKEFMEYDRTLLVTDVRRKETRKPNTHGKARSKRQKSYR